MTEQQLRNLIRELFIVDPELNQMRVFSMDRITNSAVDYAHMNGLIELPKK